MILSPEWDRAKPFSSCLEPTMSEPETPDLTKEPGRSHHEEISQLRQRVSRLEAELEKTRRRKHFRARRGPVVLFQSLIGSPGALQSLPISYISENIRQFGYEAADLMEHEADLAGLMHPEDRHLVRDIIKPETGSTAMEQKYSYRFRTAEGSYRWVTHAGEVQPGADGEPDTLTGILLDVTATREKEKALEVQVDRLHRAWEQTIALLAAITELRDPYTMGHQRRVAHLSTALARDLGLSESDVLETYNAALVHDIGKIHIPNDYLNKPGKLSPNEFAIIKEHAQVGADLLRKIHLPWNLADIVVQHHERLDGSGYPNGLQGDEILLPARILAVADVIEAMASHRPYRPALGLDVALEEVTGHAGKLYDRSVVDVCRGLFLSKGYDWSDVRLQLSPLQTFAFGGA